VAPYITLRVNDTEHKIDVDPAGFTAAELNGIERNTGMAWGKWLKMLGNREVSSLAWTALAWVAVRRAGQFAPFDEFEESLKIMELLESSDPDEVAPAVATVDSSDKAPKARRPARPKT
jgi:hypothetical protein